MTIVSQEFDHVIGVDTHAKTHTLVVLDSHGAKQAGDTFPTSPAGLKRAHAWMMTALTEIPHSGSLPLIEAGLPRC